MKRAAVVSAITSIAIALAVLAGCNGCALFHTEGIMNIEVSCD